jgi:hypothetical protein
MFNKTVMAGAVALAACGSVFALEGPSIHPHGSENFMSGALPPPGVYGMVFGNVYSADEVRDAKGNNLALPPDFKIRATAVVPRVVWVPGVNVLGGDLVVHAIAPLVSLKITAGGASQSKTGLGDMTVGAGVGYHHSPNLHSVVALDAYLPTGSYTKGDMANIGKNHTAIEPVYALSYIDPNGINADIKLGVIFNQRNSATDYKDGNEFHFDYGLGWGLGNGWTVGVGGYYAKQLSNDKIAGVSTPGTKYSGMSIGPNVKYDSGKGWFVTAKWEQETNVKNGAQGHAAWIKAVFPL